MRAKIAGTDKYESRIAGVSIKLCFSTPYHWSIACYMGHDRYEYPLPEKWVAAARTSSLIFDVGAFNGYYGLLAAKANPEARVYIFEADPVNAEHIRRNLAENGIRNATLVEAAVSDKTGTIRFSHDGSSGSRVAAWGKPMDSVALSSYGSPDLLKLDVEGHEPQAIQGADLSDTKTIFVEVNSAETLQLLSAFEPVYKDDYNAVLRRKVPVR
jgi:FkbM family methyltransferase